MIPPGLIDRILSAISAGHVLFPAVANSSSQRVHAN